MTGDEDNHLSGGWVVEPSRDGRILVDSGRPIPGRTTIHWQRRQAPTS